MSMQCVCREMGTVLQPFLGEPYFYWFDWLKTATDFEWLVPRRKCMDFYRASNKPSRGTLCGWCYIQDGRTQSCYSQNRHDIVSFCTLLFWSVFKEVLLPLQGFRACLDEEDRGPSASLVSDQNAPHFSWSRCTGICFWLIVSASWH
jgi:hypothetical protein